MVENDASACTYLVVRTGAFLLSVREYHPPERMYRSGPLGTEDLVSAPEQYHTMQQVIGHPTRSRLLRTQVANDELTPADFPAVVDGTDSEYPNTRDPITSAARTLLLHQPNIVYASKTWCAATPTASATTATSTER